MTLPAPTYDLVILLDTLAEEQARAKIVADARAAIEARIPFEMVHDGLLDAAHIDPFKVLIFPNIAALSTAQCAQIRDYVQRGGSIVATHETSLYDEWGERPLTYPIEKKASAEYHLLQFHAPSSDLLSGLDRTLRITDGVLRFRIIKLAPGVPDAPDMGSPAAAARRVEPESQPESAPAPAPADETPVAELA